MMFDRLIKFRMNPFFTLLLMEILHDSALHIISKNGRKILSENYEPVKKGHTFSFRWQFQNNSTKLAQAL